jgi:hypothetical protein
MKMNSLNERLIKEINKRFPDKKTTINYLMDTLCLGKESAYRRVNNQIFFTFQEAGVIARELGFSIDRILENESDSRILVDFPIKSNQSPFNILADKLTMDNEYMEKMLNASSCQIVGAINRIPFFLLPFKTLFKFDYCRHLYTTGHLPLMAQFCDIIIPPHIEKLHEECVYKFNRLEDITLIIGNDIGHKLIKEIQHYYNLKFISDKDLEILQAELFDFFTFIEPIIRTGENKFGSKYAIYASPLGIDTNCIHYEYGDQSMVQIWVYPVRPIIVNGNKLISNIQKKWLASAIRKSVLISKSTDHQMINILRDIFTQIAQIS